MEIQFTIYRLSKPPRMFQLTFSNLHKSKTNAKVQKRSIRNQHLVRVILKLNGLLRLYIMFPIITVSLKVNAKEITACPSRAAEDTTSALQILTTGPNLSLAGRVVRLARWVMADPRRTGAAQTRAIPRRRADILILCSRVCFV